MSLWGRGCLGWAEAVLLVVRSGLYEGVEDSVREYSLRIVEVVAFCEFSVNVEFLHSIKVRASCVEVHNFHNLIHGAK